MVFHPQQDLFQSVWMEYTTDGVYEAPVRIMQGVKGKLLDIITNYDTIGYFFQNAFISPIEAGRWNIILSFILNGKTYQFHSTFSIALKRKSRIVDLENFYIKDEFWEKDIPKENIWKEIDSLLSQIQIFILQRIWEKEDHS